MPAKQTIAAFGSSEALGKASKTSKTQTVLERENHFSLAKQTLG